MGGVERAEQGVPQEGACSAGIVGAKVPTREAVQAALRAERRSASWSHGRGGRFPPDAASVARSRGWSRAGKKFLHNKSSRRFNHS